MQARRSRPMFQNPSVSLFSGKSMACEEYLVRQIANRKQCYQVFAYSVVQFPGVLLLSLPLRFNIIVTIIHRVMLSNVGQRIVLIYFRFLHNIYGLCPLFSNQPSLKNTQCIECWRRKCFFLAFDFCRFCVAIRFSHPRHNGQ